MSDELGTPPGPAPLSNSLATGFISKQFVPGKSGNPSGRPRGKSPSRMLAKVATAEQLKAICQKILALAEAGDFQMAQLLFNRLDGKAADSILLSIGQAPKSNEDPTAFYERLVGEAELQVKRAFPNWVHISEAMEVHVTLD